MCEVVLLLYMDPYQQAVRYMCTLLYLLKYHNSYKRLILGSPKPSLGAEAVGNRQV